jgi:hypothetical protein
MRARVFNLVQYAQHPETGEKLIDEDIIKIALAHKTIKRWAYIAHDKDVYNEKDEIENGKKAGEIKPLHWHIVCQCENAVEVSVIAKWFGVSENYVDVPKGAGAFLDCVEYLTHERVEQEMMGKVRYDDSRVIANFDFRLELDNRAEKKAKYGKDLSEKDEIRYKVLYEGMTLRQLCYENPLAYQNDYSTLDKFRYKYITDRAPMPETRINYYVSGKGGIGKGLICKAIARSLYPNLKYDDDIFFEVGAKGVPFEGYDGQPVIIWNDRRAIDLLQELNGRGNVFNVFDTHPSRIKQNVKYSSVCLCNEINIVNSVQSYEDFLDGLAGEYKDKSGNLQAVEDKGQSYRRFPFIIPLHEKDFDLLMNKGFYEGTREYEQYIKYKNIRGNMQQIAEKCGNNEELRKRIEGKTVKIVVDKHNEVIEKIKCEESDEEAIMQEFEDYGEQIAENKKDIDDEFMKITDEEELPFD